jgi:hypothetical protein
MTNVRIRDVLEADHRRLDELLERAVAQPDVIDEASYEELRAGLLRHIGIEEKILLREARAARGGEPLPVAEALRVQHGAIASLLVPTPTPAIVASRTDEIVARIRAAPAVPLAPHFDGAGVHRTAASALEASRQARRKR